MDNMKTLLNGALGLQVPAEFAVENYDYETALRDELKKVAGTRSLFRRNMNDIFDLLAETLDEILPARVQEAIGVFAEIVQVPNGTRCEFVIKRGRQRGRQFVTRSTAAGNYESFRLDRERFEIVPGAIGSAYSVDFERYIDGIEDIAEGYAIIMEGMIDRLYEMIQEALLTSWNHAGRPAANKVAVNTFSASAMRQLCNTVAAYGTPVIYCTREFASEMANYLTANGTTKLSDQDMLDIRERGYIGKFFGTPVVILPQSYLDDQNTKLTMNPCFAYVIPTGKEKVVKVVMEGEAWFEERKAQDFGMEIQGYKKMGVGIVNSPNYWGIYYNAGIAAGEWAGFNTSLNITI